MMAERTLGGDYEKVLKVLVKFKSMPFLELTSMCDIDDKRLEEIIKNLENQDLVKVINPGNIYEEIVTVREKGFAFAR